MYKLFNHGKNNTSPLKYVICAIAYYIKAGGKIKKNM